MIYMICSGFPVQNFKNTLWIIESKQR